VGERRSRAPSKPTSEIGDPRSRGKRSRTAGVPSRDAHGKARRTKTSTTRTNLETGVYFLPFQQLPYGESCQIIMIAKLCATWLLALVVSPFTAPFQTCDAADVLEGTDAAVVAPTASVATAAVSLVPGRATDAGRLKPTQLWPSIFSIFAAAADLLPCQVASIRGTSASSVVPSILLSSLRL